MMVKIPGALYPREAIEKAYANGYRAAQAEHMEAVKYATGWDEADLDQVGGISDCIRVLADARDEQIKIVEQIKCCGCCKWGGMGYEPCFRCTKDELRHFNTTFSRDHVCDYWEARE